MTTDDGGAAYPYQEHDEAGLPCQSVRCGMTLLDHFAGLAMQAQMIRNDGCDGGECAGWGYEYATAMIEEKRRLEKEATDGK